MKLPIISPRYKIVVGILLIIVGFLALITPLTPGSWLAIVGLELLGFKLLSKKKLFEYYEMAKNYFFPPPKV